MAPPPIPIPTSPFARRAGFWLRAAATAVDGVAVLVLSLLGAVGAYVGAEVLGASEAAADVAVGAVGSLLLLGYSSLDVWKGATPGKMLFGMVIATAGGAPADRWRLALRWSTKYAPALFMLTYSVTQNVLVAFLGSMMNYAVLIGCLQALDEHKRTWHDEWSGTAVYRRPLSAPTPRWPATPPPLPAGQ